MRTLEAVLAGIITHCHDQRIVSRRFFAGQSTLRTAATVAIKLQVKHLFAPGRALHDHFAVCIHGKRGPIEHQFVLPAHHVGIHQRQAGFSEAGTRHIHARPLLVQMKRRGIGHQQPVCAGLHGFCSRARFPDVTADIQAKLDPFAGKHACRIAAVEYTPLVKYRMIRQMMFAIHRFNPATAQQCCNVEQPVLAALGITHDHGQLGRYAACQLRHSGQTRCRKIPPQHQIFGRIAANRHLRCDQQCRASCLRRLRHRPDFVAVTGDVTDRQIELSNTQFHELFFRAAKAACTASPKPAGLFDTTTPAASSARIFASAVPLPPAMMAPACPMRLPLGAVRPAI